MKTRQDQIDKLVIEKITGTVETCLCCCSNERLRSDIAKLVEQVLKEQEGSE